MDNLPQRTLSDIASDIACGILTGTFISQRTPPALKWWMTRVLDTARELPPPDREDVTLCTIALAGQEAALQRSSNEPPDVDFGGFNSSNGTDLLQELYEALSRRLERSEDGEPSATLFAELKIRALEAWKFYECGIDCLMSAQDIEVPLLSQEIATKHLRGWQTDSDVLIHGRPGFLLDVAEAHLTLGNGAAAWPWLEAALSHEPDKVMLERLVRMCGIDAGWELGELAYPSLEAYNWQLYRPFDGYKEIRGNVSKQFTLMLESWLVERDPFSAIKAFPALSEVNEQAADVQPPINLETVIWGYYWLVEVKQFQRKGAEVSRLCKRFLEECEDGAFKAVAVHAGVWETIEAIRNELREIQAELSTLPIPGQHPESEGALREMLVGGWDRLSEREQHSLTQLYYQYRTRGKLGIPLDYMLVGGLGTVLEQVARRQLVSPLEQGLPRFGSSPQRKQVSERWRDLFGYPDIRIRVMRYFGPEAANITSGPFRNRMERAIEIRNKAVHGEEVSELECDEMYKLLLAPGQEPGSGLLAQLLALSAK